MKFNINNSNEINYLKVKEFINMVVKHGTVLININM